MLKDHAALRRRVKKLRQKGKTYAEIQKKLRVRISKGTLSFWCKDINLPQWYEEKINRLNRIQIKKAREVALVVNKKKRQNYLALLLKRNSHLLKKIDIGKQKIILSTLYLGEGSKHKNTQALTLGSTNPGIIKFYLQLLKNCYNIDDSRLRERIQCRFDQNQKDLEIFWQKLTKIKPPQFYPTYCDKRTLGKPTKKIDYKGICTIYYCRTEIQLELELLAEAIIKAVTKGR